MIWPSSSEDAEADRECRRRAALGLSGRLPVWYREQSYPALHTFILRFPLVLQNVECPRSLLAHTSVLTCESISKMVFI